MIYLCKTGLSQTLLREYLRILIKKLMSNSVSLSDLINLTDDDKAFGPGPHTVSSNIYALIDG